MNFHRVYPNFLKRLSPKYVLTLKSLKRIVNKIMIFSYAVSCQILIMIFNAIVTCRVHKISRQFRGTLDRHRM